MLTFKEFLYEDREAALKGARELAARGATQGEREAAKAAIHRLTSKGNVEPKKEPPKKAQLTIGTNATKGWEKPSHMMQKPNGERRYISYHPEKKIYKTHNRSQSQYKHHESLKKAQKHLHDEGYTKQYSSKEVYSK